MSRSFANGLGVASVAILVLLVANDVESLFHPGVGYPRVVGALMIMTMSILANAYLTYRIVRGQKLEPSYSKEELRELMEEAARGVIREEVELLAGKIVLRDLANEFQSDPLPMVPKPRPHLIRSNENN